jgi:hypothetical protein
MPVAGFGMSAVELENSVYALGGNADYSLDTSEVEFRQPYMGAHSFKASPSRLCPPLLQTLKCTWCRQDSVLLHFLHVNPRGGSKLLVCLELLQQYTLYYDDGMAQAA